MGVTHPILDCLWRGAWFDRLTSGENSGEALLFASQPCVSESCIGGSAWLRGQVEGPSLPRP